MAEKDKGGGLEVRRESLRIIPVIEAGELSKETERRVGYIQI